MRNIKLDFADLTHVYGAREVVASFDVGFALLHELVHGVLHLADAVGDRELGECEAFVNRMRRELNLPERQAYSYSIKLIKLTSSAVAYQAELAFARAHTQSGQTKLQKLYLNWDAARVGGIDRKVGAGGRAVSLTRKGS